MPLDIRTKLFLKYTKRVQAKHPVNSLDPEEVRRQIAKATRLMQFLKVPIANVDDLSLPFNNRITPIRIYRPNHEKANPALVFFHGGGWVVGNLDTHDNCCRRLAKYSDCTVVSVDYGLAPEHKFPEPVEEAYNAAKWIAENGREIGIDTGRIAVGGDSAGGNLAAVVSLLARDRGTPKISYQMLLYPATDLAGETKSKREKAHGYFLNENQMMWFGEHYLNSPEDAKSPLASPLLAESLKDVPDTFMLTVDNDPLKDEGEALARRLEEEGVRVKHLLCRDAIHGFASMPSIIFKQKNRTLKFVGNELKKNLKK